MCGIAGVIDLKGDQAINQGTSERMANAIYHRGPDEGGFLYGRGVGLASRRLSIVGLHDGQQPIYNEDGTVAVVFNGELFNFPEQRAELEALGHIFKTSCDTEILVHLWEELGEGMLEKLRGQFAFALYDFRQQVLVLARDRVGICPLHWARWNDRLYFCSEIKGILASGEVPVEADPRGIDHIFTFFAMPTRRTCFKGISSLLPGSSLKIQFRGAGSLADITERVFWDLNFPDRGDEYDPPDENILVDEFEAKFQEAVRIRLRADVPVVSYLSGGVDSTTVLATSSKVQGSPLPSFTIKIPTPSLDETDRALMAAKTVGSHPTVITCGEVAIAHAYPKLVEATESPVMDTSCAAMLCLSKEVNRQGYKVALTGEGADEALAGYPWLKINRLLCWLDGDRFHTGNLARRFIHRLFRPRSETWFEARKYQDLIGGPLGITELYGLLSTCRGKFYSPDMMDRLDGHIAYEDLQLNLERMRRWHPLNRSIYFGYKTMLPGLLLHQKGDRPAMHHSVETRYPFLDEDFIEFCAKVHPRWKLRGINRDKHLLRRYSSRFLPPMITHRPKKMFRAPFANSFFANPPAYCEQLLSSESLRKAGYFDPESVQQIRQRYARFFLVPGKRIILEMGLTIVMSTQLWHHLYLGGGLCELPTVTANLRASMAPRI